MQARVKLCHVNTEIILQQCSGLEIINLAICTRASEKEKSSSPTVKMFIPSWYPCKVVSNDDKSIPPKAL